jgi:hypothetical protein
VTFSAAINPTTFTTQALSLTLNGGPNLITSGITITNVGGNTYEIDGLQSLGSAPGQYQLSLNSGLLTDLDGNAGVGNPSVTWQVLPAILPAAFSALTLPSTITYGDSTVIVSGTISSGNEAPGDNEFVAIALNGNTVDAPINAQGDFAASLDTSTLPASSTPYQITYSYAGDSTLSSASDSSTTTVTVEKAAPTLALPVAPTLTYDGTSDATNWVTATLSGVSGAATPTGTTAVAYYSGTATSGTALSSLPVNAGTYTVVASYGGDSNYAAAQTSVTFTINRAPTTTTLPSPPASIVANGTTSVTSWVTATVTGIAGAPAPSGLPTFTYYSGPSATGTPLTSSPTTAGTYTVVANYGGNSNYLPSSASATFTINPAVAVTTTMLVNGLPSTGSIANTQRSEVTSLVINFSSPVTLAAGAITLTDQDPTNPFGSAGANVPFILTVSNNGATYTLTFSGTGFVSRGSLPTSLPNGHYILTVNFAQVSSTNGTVPSGTQTLMFHRLYGDLTNAGYVTTTEARADASSSNWASYEQFLDNDGASFSAGFDSADSSALSAAESFVTGTQEQDLWSLFNQ